MPRSKSAKKREALTKKKTERNQALEGKMKGIIKKVDRSIAKKTPNAAALAKETAQIIDKMASKGIIHKNQAARRKSRLAKKIPPSA